jgi:hypothetical protein
LAAFNHDTFAHTCLRASPSFVDMIVAANGTSCLDHGSEVPA